MLAEVLLSTMMFQAYGVEAEKTAQKPVCNSNMVTRDCKFFEERKDQEKIKLADGSFIRNPMYVGLVKGTDGGNGLYGGPYDSAGTGGGYTGTGMGSYPGSNFDYEKMLVNQADILDKLDTTPVSTPFKIMLSQSAGYLAANPNTPYSVPWPPTDKNAKLSPITGAEIFKYLQEKMSPEDYKALMKTVDLQKEPQVKAQLAQQKAQQELLAQQQKFQEEAAETAKLVSKKKDRVRELYKYTQEKLMAVVSNGRKESDLSEAQKRAIAKIKTIQLRDLDDAFGTAGDCSTTGSDNAVYMSGTHEFRICPGILTMSDETIVFIMAHEMSHSIDACNFQFPLISVDNAKLQTYLADPKVSTQEKADTTAILGEKPKNLINVEPNLYVANPTLTKSLRDAGVFQEQVPAGSYPGYLFAAELSCMQKQNGIRMNDRGDIAYTKKLLQEAVDGETDPELKKSYGRSAKRYGEALTKYPQCFRNMKLESQAGEASADMLGSVVLEKYLADYPPKDEAEKVSAFAFFTQSSCKPGAMANSIKAPVDSYPPSVISKSLKATIEDAHPADADRVSKIMLNLPGTAALFDCRRQAVACFDNLSFSKRTGTDAKSFSPTQTQQGAQ